MYRENKKEKTRPETFREKETVNACVFAQCIGKRFEFSSVLGTLRQGYDFSGIPGLRENVEVAMDKSEHYG